MHTTNVWLTHLLSHRLLLSSEKISWGWCRCGWSPATELHQHFSERQARDWRLCCFSGPTAASLSPGSGQAARAPQECSVPCLAGGLQRCMGASNGRVDTVQVCRRWYCRFQKLHHRKLSLLPSYGRIFMSVSLRISLWPWVRLELA